MELKSNNNGENVNNAKLKEMKNKILNNLNDLKRKGN